VKRYSHNLSNYRLVSGDMGELIPVCWYEALPGDSWRQRTSALVRMSPMLAPVMHPVTIRFHHWFVPNRLIWADWEKFITGGPDGLDATVHPTISSGGGGFTAGALADYLGVGAESSIAGNLGSDFFGSAAGDFSSGALSEGLGSLAGCRE